MVKRQIFGAYDTKEIQVLMTRKCSKINLREIGDRPTAVFVTVSDTDRSMDVLANLFFTQAMNELCLHADEDCLGNRLGYDVRFILDDFATNCVISDFPRMISSIRSRGISVMLMIQAESQLKSAYGEDKDTIINNCDTYVYLGGNDIATADAVSKRCNRSLQSVLAMPVGTNWVFRRGAKPVNGKNYELEELEKKIFGNQDHTEIKKWRESLKCS